VPERENGYHVADEQEVAQADGLWPEDDDGGEGEGQHQVPRRDRVGHHEEPATIEARERVRGVSSIRHAWIYITGIVGSLDGRANDTDRSAGKSSKRAWNWKNWVKTESVSSEVPVAMAAARAGPKAATLSTKSRSATHRLPRSARRKNGTPVFRGAVVVAAAGTAADDAAAAGGGGAVATDGALPWSRATSSRGITVAAAPASLVLMVGCCVVGAS